MLIMHVPFTELLVGGTSCAGVSVTHSISSGNHIEPHRADIIPTLQVW